MTWLEIVLSIFLLVLYSNGNPNVVLVYFFNKHFQSLGDCDKFQHHLQCPPITHEYSKPNFCDAIQFQWDFLFIYEWRNLVDYKLLQNLYLLEDFPSKFQIRILISEWKFQLRNLANSSSSSVQNFWLRNLSTWAFSIEEITQIVL